MEITYTENGVMFGEQFISLEEITKNVNDTKINKQGLSLMTIHWKGGRGFDGCEERIVLPIDKIKKIKKIIIGRHINFGEIAGKHSEVYGTIEESDITVTKNKNHINDFLSQHPSGHYADHSFLDVFSDHAMDGHYEDIDEECAKEFIKLY